MFNGQLKEMVLALLHESDLMLSNDAVEIIVQKASHFFVCITFPPQWDLIIILPFWSDIHRSRSERRWKD